MNIQNLKSNTTWQEASNTINNNNNKISLAIATLENAKLKNKGYFTTLEKLKEAVPNPTIGSKAYVGTSEPYAIYIVENGVWVDSGYTGGNEIVANDIIISDSGAGSYDFAIADEKGNVILRLQDGGIFTKNFSSDESTPGNPAISGVPEAPMDGKTYGRNNGAWNVITSNGESYLGSIEYTGQKIVFPKMNYKQLGTLPNNQQCCIIHKNLAIFVNGTKYWVTDKYNKFNVLKSGDTGITGLHSNVGSLGIECYNGNTIPLLYLTDWEGKKGVQVFDLKHTTYTMTRLQYIIPSSNLLKSNIFGLGNTDFIVDKENGFLYSICYKENTWREIETNKTCICKFALPSISAGSNITLGLEDIIDHFEVENIPTRQDCCIHNGILYIENGYMNPHYKATLRAIDLSKKEVVSKIDISKIVDGEPECLEFDEDHLLMAYGKTIYGLYF